MAEDQRKMQIEAFIHHIEQRQSPLQNQQLTQLSLPLLKFNMHWTAAPNWVVVHLSYT